MRPEATPFRSEPRGPRPSLACTQKALLAMITRGPGDGPADGADTLVVGDARATAGERVAVHANMYQLRMAEALESQFPRLAKWLGANDFAALSARYVDDHPSRHPSLRSIGQHLPGWLDDNQNQWTTMRGLAQLEWARTDVFDLVDESVLTTEDVHSWAPDRFGELPLRLIGAHRLITVPAGTAQQWDALGPEVADVTDVLAPHTVATESVLVWREGIAVYHRLIEAREYAAVEQAAAGTQFGVLCESLLVGDGDEQAVICQTYAWLSTWLADGLLASRATSPSSDQGPAPATASHTHITR